MSTTRTHVARSATTLLLANIFKASLTYAGATACRSDAALIKKTSTGCTFDERCTSSANEPTITVGCEGGPSCSGCVLPKFFTAYQFKDATFV
jgi:hypothetical protein